MTDFDDLKSRILENLGNPSGAAYSDALITEAVRQAVEYFDIYYPQVETKDITLTSTDREVELDLLVNCKKVVSINKIPAPAGYQVEQSPPYYVYFKGAIPWVKFLGLYNPTIGDQFLVTYVTTHWIDGLDDAEQTTIPFDQRSLFVRGASSLAKLIRVNAINSSYGSQNSETDRLCSTAKSELSQFITDLSFSQSFQHAGYPKGFDI